ncbi:hypothetical protein MHY1_01313 [Methylovirgula sp. HY1]|nr:hypothetical protein MHY1_01313 [Methylovirgula sp. HY1]
MTFPIRTCSSLLIWSMFRKKLNDFSDKNMLQLIDLECFLSIG